MYSLRHSRVLIPECIFLYVDKYYSTYLLLENEELPINDLKLGIEELSKASQSFAEKLYADTQNDSNSESTNETDDVVEGEVIEDE